MAIMHTYKPEALPATSDNIPCQPDTVLPTQEPEQPVTAELWSPSAAEIQDKVEQIASTYNYELLDDSTLDSSRAREALRGNDPIEASVSFASADAAKSRVLALEYRPGEKRHQRGLDRALRLFARADLAYDAGQSETATTLYQRAERIQNVVAAMLQEALPAPKHRRVVEQNPLSSGQARQAVLDGDTSHALTLFAQEDAIKSRALALEYNPRQGDRYQTALNRAQRIFDRAGQALTDGQLETARTEFDHADRIQNVVAAMLQKTLPAPKYRIGDGKISNDEQFVDTAGSMIADVDTPPSSANHNASPPTQAPGKKPILGRMRRAVAHFFA